MKNAFYSILVAILALFMSCAKFEPATVDLKATADSTLTTVSCKADITDMGGLKYISDKGFCIGLKTNPSYNSTNNKTYSIEGQDKTFSIILPLDLQDTVYYIRAFVKTDAGMGYSKTVPVKTYTSAK